jgi:hypothetical protein
MGYRKTTRRVQVSLKNHTEYGSEDEFPEAVARGKTLAEYLSLMGYAEADNDADEDKQGLVRQLEEFADSLISWNLEAEDGTPLPCTREAFFEIDQGLALALATEWIDRLAGKVDAPLQQSSPAGEPSPAPSAIPMAPLSDLPLPSSVPA